MNDGVEKAPQQKEKGDVPEVSQSHEDAVQRDVAEVRVLRDPDLRQQGADDRRAARQQDQQVAPLIVASPLPWGTHRFPF